VQAFYEPDHSWYDARVVKSVAKRMTKRQKAAMAASSRNAQDKEDLLQSFSTVVVFDDGFPGKERENIALFYESMSSGDFEVFGYCKSNGSYPDRWQDKEDYKEWLDSMSAEA
jgi:hypothetical protein